jgi:hypothetical protein
MTATPGAPDASSAIASDAIAATLARTARRSGSLLLTVASEATIALGALWLLTMAVPYLGLPDGTSVALADGGPFRASTVAPRLVGVVLSAAPAALALALPRWRAALFATAAAASTALATYSVWWALGLRTGGAFTRQLGWYADVVLAVGALLTVAIGIVGIRRSLTGQPAQLDNRSEASTPFVAVAVAVVALLTDWMLSRDPLFPTGFASAANAMAVDETPLSMRLVAAAMAVLLVVVPVLATLTRDRRVGQGIAVGWPAMVAVLAARVLTVPGHSPDAGFHAALGVIVLTTTGVVVWLERTGLPRRPGAPPTIAERPAHEPEPDRRSHRHRTGIGGSTSSGPA